MKFYKTILYFIICACLLSGCGSKKPEPLDINEVHSNLSIEGGGISRFKENQNATPLAESKYIKIIDEPEYKDIVITDSNQESITLNRDVVDIMELGNFKVCYYGTQFIGTTTPTDYYIVDISNADAGDILTIKNAYGAEINTVEDSFIYTIENKDIIYTAADDTLVIDE